MNTLELLRSSKLKLVDKVDMKSSPEDDVVLIQYEAEIPEERSEGFAEVGHNHMYAVKVSTSDKTFFKYKHVTVAERSLPVTYKLTLSPIQQSCSRRHLDKS